LGVDVFATFLGALSLIFIFSIIILELVRKNSFTGRVWFEAAWVGFFFVLEFCAAVSLSVIGPGVMCVIQMTEIDDPSCSSTRVLLVFSWICTLLLLGYLMILTIAAYHSRKENPRVWQCTVRQFFSSGSRIYRADLESPPLPTFVKGPVSIVAPQPRRPPLQVIIPRHSPHTSGDGADRFKASARPIPPIPAAPPPQHHRQNTRDATAVAFYPTHLQSGLQSLPISTRPIPPAGASPPPLGSWPRADIMSQPSRQAPKTLILASSIGPSYKSRTSPTSKAISPKSGMTPTSATRMLPTRPGGSPTGRPRGAGRPPPLDLSKISAHSTPNK
jgi:hypothetical protein